MPELLTLEEVAGAARMSVRSVYRMLDDGRGPTLTRIGRRVYIARPDAEAWFARMRQPSAMAQAAA